MLDVFFCDGAVLGSVAIKVSVLQQGAMPSLLFRHVPEHLGYLQGIGIAKFGEQLGELSIDFGVPLFDEDGDVQNLLCRQ